MNWIAPHGIASNYAFHSPQLQLQGAMNTWASATIFARRRLWIAPVTSALSLSDPLHNKRNVASSALTREPPIAEGRFGWNSTLEPQELLLLVDRVLGPSGAIWQQHRRQQQQQKLEDLTDPLAFNVGQLATLGQFALALKMMEGLAINQPETLGMWVCVHGAWRMG